MKPGVKTITAGTLLFVLGVIVFPLYFILSFLSKDNEWVQFVVPGSAEIQAVESNRYYLWNDYKTVFKGRNYNHSENLPAGLEIKVVDIDTGKQVPFFTDQSISENRQKTSSKSVGYIDTHAPTRLKIIVSNIKGPRIFSFSQSSLVKIMDFVLRLFACAMLFGFAGAIITVPGIVKLIKSNRKQPLNPH